ncbi:hypothetical protein Pla110_08060 [Polystyrenella longa]|uniref:DoxX n=1 Tax=Polystyrenella longa TaxID=2528007 RepID=A0A518CIQ0_9PLAN|nr:DoxX family protein [Polystyrenella longa]QDU79102.1 hypothetical protein Pla110_08060 [Polystyrenella longa]
MNSHSVQHSLLLKIAMIAVRVALAFSFLSAVADRFGLWGEPGTGEVAWGNFTAFTDYTAMLLWFLPQGLVPLFAWMATVIEIVLAIGLLVGYQLRIFAYGSSLMLLTFALSMSVATGAEGPFTYSVWTASAAAFLLGTLSVPTGRGSDFN